MGDVAGSDELIHRGDTTELLLEVDRLCARRDWPGLVELRDRCQAAVELGKQLWSVAQFAEYRLALEAPGPYAASVCRAGAGRFALGPLTEVAASTHRWEELADGLVSPWVAATVAQERVLRGEDLTGDPRAHPEELELPLALQPWEPEYPLPVYRPYELHEGGAPPLDSGFEQVDGAPAPPSDRPRLAAALAEVGATWAEQSNGGCLVAVVTGDAAGAAAALFEGPVRMAPVNTAGALARLGWAAASGGAYGRRSGMAAGRSQALWVAHAITGLPFPADPDQLGAALQLLRWHVVEDDPAVVPPQPGAPAWSLRLAVEDPRAGWAACVDAWDRRRDEEAQW